MISIFECFRVSRCCGLTFGTFGAFVQWMFERQTWDLVVRTLRTLLPWARLLRFLWKLLYIHLASIYLLPTLWQGFFGCLVCIME